MPSWTSLSNKSVWKLMLNWFVACLLCGFFLLVYALPNKHTKTCSDATFDCEMWHASEIALLFLFLIMNFDHKSYRFKYPQKSANGLIDASDARHVLVMSEVLSQKFYKFFFCRFLSSSLSRASQSNLQKTCNSWVNCISSE